MSSSLFPHKPVRTAVSDSIFEDEQRAPHRGSAKQVLVSLLAFVLLLVLIRGSLAALGTDTYERGEEYVRGSVAVAIQGGLDLPIEGLFYHYYEGGGFVQALLTIPAFAMMGPSFLAHKAVAIFADVLVLLAGCMLARRAFGFRALVIFGLLFVFSPLPFQKLALLNLGIHYHALVFQFVVAGLTLRLLQERNEPGAYSASTPWLLGLAGGFGFFYNYQLAPLIGLAGLALLFRRTLTMQRWGHLIAGCLIGLLPLFFMGSRVGIGVIDIHGDLIEIEVSAGEDLVDMDEDIPVTGELVQGTGPSPSERQKDILAMKERRAPSLSKLPAGIVAASGPRGLFQLALFLAIPILGLLRIRKTPRSERTSKQDASLLIASYLVIFSTLIPISGFMVTYFPEYFMVVRYAPFWGFATLLIAGTLASFAESGHRLVRRVSWGLGGLVLALGTWGYGEGIAQASQPSFGEGLERLADRRGTDFRAYYSKLANRMHEDRPSILRTLVGVQGIPRDEVYSAAAEGVYRHSKMTLPEIVLELQAASPEHWQAYLPGLGAWAMKGKRGYMRLGKFAIVKGTSELPQGVDRSEVERLMMFGLGSFGTGGPLRVEALESELNKLQSGKFTPSAFEGFGHRCFRLFVLRPEAFEDFISTRSDSVRAKVTKGFDKAAALRSIHAPNTF